MYPGFYKKTSDFVYSQQWFTIDDGSTVQLPPFGKKTDQENFLDLYEALEKTTDFQRNERYFKKEIVQYHKFKIPILT